MRHPRRIIERSFRSCDFPPRSLKIFQILRFSLIFQFLPFYVRTECGIYRLCYPAVSVRSMKNFCSILVAVVMVTHLHCGASCLTESAGKAAQMPVTTEPPSHQYTNVPMNNSHAPHETDTPCSQGPVLEAKIMLSGKWVQHSIAALPLEAPVLNVDQYTGL